MAYDPPSVELCKSPLRRLCAVTQRNHLLQAISVTGNSNTPTALPSPQSSSASSV
ncbi:unnamed protein product [Ceratitis capitata]|uniref:(Mediterranean fruit fly) hypothetical protein n=1 Tax=Ceratitis capitata TaxID=7213 RepID=A0A811UE72_CERCA|nr:unnamed protein product [Ceratitis capitata]